MKFSNAEIDDMSMEDIDKKLDELNKDRKVGDPRYAHPYTGDYNKYYLSSPQIVENLDTRQGRGGGNKKGNRKTLVIKCTLKNIYKNMKSMIDYICKLSNVDTNELLSTGLTKLSEDDVVIYYTLELNSLKDDDDICTSTEFTSWNSRDEDFHFVYECSEFYNITYSSNLDMIISDLSNDLKMHKHKVVALALNYACKSAMENVGHISKDLYKQMCEEINWFRKEYRIKANVLHERFPGEND